MTPKLIIITFALFGAWTLLCIVVGAWLMHRKQARQSPMPPMFEKVEQLVHACMGKPGDGQDDEPARRGFKRKNPDDRARV